MFAKKIFSCSIVFIFVNLTILAGRQSSFPYVSGDSFRAIADHLYDETTTNLNPNDVKPRDVIFLKTDLMPEFFKYIHPYIKHKYILITHNSDLPAPGQFESLLNDEKIIHWFGMNPTIKANNKFTPIPIGIANTYHAHGNIQTFNKILMNRTLTARKSILLGLNFNPGTNIFIRRPIYNLFINKTYCTDISSNDHATYLNNMMHAYFILSPPGNGLDCHRTWEALLMGAIPIVIHSLLDSIFENMPVLIVKSWDEVTESFLSKNFQEFTQKKFNTEKSYFSYWFALIDFYKRKP